MKIRMLEGKKNLIGSRLKAARLKGSVAVTQQDLAARLSVMGLLIDRTAVSRIEAGKRLVTDYELYAISKALNLPVDWFFGAVRAKR